MLCWILTHFPNPICFNVNQLQKHSVYTLRANRIRKAEDFVVFVLFEVSLMMKVCFAVNIPCVTMVLYIHKILNYALGWHCWAIVTAEILLQCFQIPILTNPCSVWFILSLYLNMIQPDSVWHIIKARGNWIRWFWVNPQNNRARIRKH